jgi:molybdopterin molybdotransferase
LTGKLTMSTPLALLPIEEALGRVLAQIVALPAETLPLAAVYQRVLAEAIAADADVPAFDRSAMDGIALRSADGLLGAVLQQVGESAAGTPFQGHVLAGQCVRVMTGGVVPRGADAVLPVERIERLDGGQYRLLEAVRPEQNVSRQGSEVQEGAAVLASGTRLTGARMGVLATYGRDQVPVVRRPVVAVLPTGNEIVPVTATPALGQVRDANRHAVTGLLLAAGAEVRQYPVAPDTREALTAAIAHAWQDADVLVTSGGVSAGDYDLVPPVLEALGATAHFHKIAIKPGKPLLFATREFEGRRQYAFGLPGNPVSSYVCCALFVLPALLALQGAPAEWQRFQLPCLTALPATGPRAEILPATLTAGGQADVQPLSSSADLTRFCLAEWFAYRPAHAAPTQAGEAVTLFALPRP